MTVTVNLSELRTGALINHNGEVILKEQAIELITSGDQVTEMYTISQNWITKALKNAYRDALEEINEDTFTAPDPDAQLIIIDKI